VTRTRIRDRILVALRDHPLLSRRQLELYLNRPARSVRQGLEELVARKLVVRYNGRQPGLHTRALFALSPQGVQELAQGEYVSVSEYEREYGLHRARMERLILNLERVFQLRTLFLWLARGKLWRSIAWDVEVGKFFSVKHGAFWVPFHAAALMQMQPTENSPQGGGTRWALVVVELDVGRVPVQRDRERLMRLVAAQKDRRYLDRDARPFFPIMVVIAQDEFRLQDYYSALRAAALSQQIPMPSSYLTTFREMLTLRNDSANPIWYSTTSGTRTSLLFDALGISDALPDQLPWRKMPLTAQGEEKNIDAITLEPALSSKTLSEANGEVEGMIAPLKPSASAAKYAQASMGAIALTLGPLEKRLLDEIAAHPLLTDLQLGSLVRATMRRTKPGVELLQRFKLIDERSGKYLVGQKGVGYLASVAGFGKAVERYVRARGWGRGFESLLHYWKHTQEENEFFLHLATVARRHRHSLTWYSELESRLYYQMDNQWHSFLPDGRGTYEAKGERYEFVLEVDRSRMSNDKIRRKFTEYSVCLASNVLRGEGIEHLRVLVLTTSLERAETLRRTITSVASNVPVFITTLERLRKSGADQPIWLKVEGSSFVEQGISAPKTYCFECFDS